MKEKEGRKGEKKEGRKEYECNSAGGEKERVGEKDTVSERADERDEM